MLRQVDGAGVRALLVVVHGVPQVVEDAGPYYGCDRSAAGVVPQRESSRAMEGPSSKAVAPQAPRPEPRAEPWGGPTLEKNDPVHVVAQEGEPLSDESVRTFARTGMLVVGSMGNDMCEAARRQVLQQIAADRDCRAATDPPDSDTEEDSPEPTLSPAVEAAGAATVTQAAPLTPAPAPVVAVVAATPPSASQPVPAPPAATAVPRPPAVSPSGKGVSALRQAIAKRHVRRVVRAQNQRHAAARAAPLSTPRAAADNRAPMRVRPRSTAMLLTVHERRVVLQQRTLLVLAALSNGLSLSATMHIKLGLVGFNAGRIATATGQQLALISLCELLLGPIVAAASDRFGRLPFLYLRCIGRLSWLASLFAVRSIERYQEWGVFSFGVLGAGAGSVQHAALDDLFASRPALNAQIQARNSAWTSAVGLIAPIVGAEIGRRSVRWALVGSLVVGGLQIPLMLFAKETLHPSQRKPLRLAKADPLRNLSVLFCNGAPLRRLAIANLLLQASAWSQQTMQSFQIGSLGWTPADQTYYGSFQSLLGIMTQGSVVMPLLSRLGSKRAFEMGSLFSAAGLLLVSQAGRPLSASKLRKTVQLVVALLVMVPGHVCGLAMRTMIVKQAEAEAAAPTGERLKNIHASEQVRGAATPGVRGAAGAAPAYASAGKSHAVGGLGLGELNAALNGLRSLLAVAMPLAWGWFCNFCFEGRGGAHWWCAPGAQFILAAALRLICRQLVANCSIAAT